ncbi:MAG: DUF4242 domain-containing protein [Devosia sp.]|nr:DUF4242 domain-containing protein [Devosia sp.]
MTKLKRFLIERDVQGAGAMTTLELCGAARASNSAIEKLATDLQWQHSYVTNDKIFCIYLAKDEQTILRHGELSGIPVTKITEVSGIIDPLTANN